MCESTPGRRIGVALLGLVCGGVAGFVIHELVARIVLAVNDGLLPDSLALALLLGYVTPVLAVVGLFTAVGMERRRCHGTGEQR